MRELKIGEQELRIRATPLALLYYKQEFNADLVGDMVAMRAMETDPSRIDSVVFLQIIWAMARADSGFGNLFPSFAEWVAGLELFDMSDSELLRGVMEEAADGFFRSGNKSGAKKQTTG